MATEQLQAPKKGAKVPSKGFSFCTPLVGDVKKRRTKKSTYQKVLNFLKVEI